MIEELDAFKPDHTTIHTGIKASPVHHLLNFVTPKVEYSIVDVIPVVSRENQVLSVYVANYSLKLQLGHGSDVVSLLWIVKEEPSEERARCSQDHLVKMILQPIRIVILVGGISQSDGSLLKVVLAEGEPFRLIGIGHDGSRVCPPRSQTTTGQAAATGRIEGGGELFPGFLLYVIRFWRGIRFDKIDRA